MTSSINSNDTSSHSNSELTTIDQNSNFKSNHQNFSLISFDHLGSFPISSVMNQPKNQNITSTAFTAIRSSIPINLKPTNLSSLVNLQSSSQSSILAPSHKRSNPPQIKLSEPPKINLSDFDPYLKQIQTEWSRWEKNLNINSNLNQNSNHSSSSTVHNLSNLSLNSNPINLINSKLPSISIVPNIFFKKSFSLSDPETFDLITQTPSFNSNLNQNSNSSINHQSDSSSILDLATDQILQEKLSHYLDIVQLHLVQEISLRSTSFFSALGNLQSLHAQTAFCRSQMENLIHQLDQLKSSVAQRGLDLIRFSIRRKNITKLDHALNKLKDIWNTLRSIEELIQSGDWLTALNLIESLESIWNSSRFNSLSTNHLAPTSTFHSSSSPSISLRLNKIKALAYLPDQLSSFRNIISKALEAELTSILSHDLKVNLQNFLNLNPFESDLSQPKSPSHPLSASLEEIMPKGFFQIQQSTKEKLKDRIRLTFDGLARVAGLDKAILSWRQAVIKQTRETIKNVLSDVIELEQEDQDNNSDISLLDSKDKQSILNEKTVNLSRSLKELLPDQFLKISKETYQQLLSCLQIVDTQSFALLDLANDFNAQNIHSNASTYQPETSLKSNSSENPRINSQDVEKSSSQMIDIENLSLKLSGVVQDTAELANVRFAKVIGVRSEIHAQLNSVEFFDIFHTSWQFVVRCEVISRRMIVALRAVLVRQAKAFLQSFHQKKITESAKVLEQEQWTQVEIPSQIQKIVNAIISSAMEDSKLFILPKQSSIVPSELTESPKTIPLSKQLDIEGTPFHTVSAVLESLNTLADYLKIVINCSILTTDTMGKIIEFLKAFNSRTCQVVLGAGAIRSAGLKNITAKHLALASQALSTMISLIPYVRECLRRHLSPKQAVMLVDFDKLKRDYQEHQNEIHAKLVSIMSDRLAMHHQTLQAIDWESLESLSSDPNPYLENLLKEVTTLHRVLSRYLLPSTLQAIMTQVFSAIHLTLSEEFSKANVQSGHAKERLLRDMQFLSSKLNELNATDEIQEKVKDFQETLNKKLLLKEAKSESNDDSAKVGSSPSTSPLTGNFRARFRFLSPGRPALKSPLPSPAQVEKPSNLSEDLPPTCPETKVAESEVALEQNQTSSTIENEIEEMPMQDNPTQSLGAAIPSLPIDPQPSQTHEPQLVLPLSETVTETSSPNPSQPPKLTLSQRLTALATNRKGSPSSLVTSSSAQVNVAQDASNVTTSSIDIMPQVESTNDIAQKAPNADEEPEKSKIIVSRQSFKERLAAIAAKAASTSARASSDQQAIETLSESAVLTQSKTRDVENVINEVEQEVVFPVAQEQLHELPPLPNSAISEKFSNESKSMVEEGNVGLDEDMNGLVLSNGINTPQKAQDFKDDGEGNLDGIIDQEQNESTKAKVDPGNVVMDSGEAQIQTDEENIKFTSNHNDEKLQMKERLKI